MTQTIHRDNVEFVFHDVKQLKMTKKLYDWFAKVLEDDSVQQKISEFDNEDREKLSEIYDLFHKKCRRHKR